MMDSAGWYTAIGVLLVGMALAASLVRRLPITTSIVYLGAGAILGRTGWLDVDPVRNRFVVETLAEAAVLISLFAAGLKVRAPLKDRLWRLPLRMASVGMVITIAIVAVMGRWLGLSWGESVLLAAILAPTDPVLASEVQLAHPHDTDRLRFTLTGEAGLNDGAAFPFVMFGLGALGLHEVGPAFSRWALWDLLWPVAGGLLIGAAFGTVIARLTLFLRRTHKEAVGLDDFLALGLIGLSYGAALNLGAYGFLSVFAAGLALRRVERMEGDVPPTDVRLQGEAADALATDPERAPAYMAQAALGFIEQMERLAEVAVVVMVGAMLPRVPHPGILIGFVAALMVVARPVATWLALVGTDRSTNRTLLAGWFGMRGVGSVYYLAFALGHGLQGPAAGIVTTLTLWTIAASVVLHGVSVTPLLAWYERTRGR